MDGSPGSANPAFRALRTCMHFWRMRSMPPRGTKWSKKWSNTQWLKTMRHACGYALANAGHDTRSIQDWLGHRSIQYTVRYTELAPTRFRDFWGLTTHLADH